MSLISASRSSSHTGYKPTPPQVSPLNPGPGINRDNQDLLDSQPEATAAKTQSCLEQFLSCLLCCCKKAEQENAGTTKARQGGVTAEIVDLVIRNRAGCMEKSRFQPQVSVAILPEISPVEKPTPTPLPPQEGPAVGTSSDPLAASMFVSRSIVRGAKPRYRKLDTERPYTALWESIKCNEQGSIISPKL